MQNVLVLFVGIVSVATFTTASEGPNFGNAVNLIGTVLTNYINSQTEDITLAPGIHVVSFASENDIKGRSADDGTLFGAVQKYLDNHEIRIKLPEILPDGQRFGKSLKEAYDNASIVEGRGKKGGGGLGAIGILGGMMGSMMGALGLGGVGLLAMKALMVSALALMLSLVVGIKKLASGHEEGGHHVIHASGHGGHERRRREAADIAYRGWDYSESS